MYNNQPPIFTPEGTPIPLSPMSVQKPRFSFNFKNLSKNTKIVLISIASLLVLGLIILAIVLIGNGKKSATLEISVAPASATIKINGSAMKNGTYRVEPGFYEAEITADGFDSYSGKIELKKGDDNGFLVVLFPTDEASDYYDTHPDDDALAGYTANRAIVVAERNSHTDPIWQFTPYHSEDGTFMIDPTLAEDGTLVVQLTLNSCFTSRQDEAKSAIENWFKENSLSLENYDYFYIVPSCN